MGCASVTIHVPRLFFFTSPLSLGVPEPADGPGPWAGPLCCPTEMDGQHRTAFVFGPRTEGLPTSFGLRAAVFGLSSPLGD
ncbi:hypothetical protein JTE90_022787 [Oedothorax gibbosus]|uniref:Secreted protein n=1 Tax=Oedothorax gibbosus TaxID=931172 RepID=A0AAV6U8Y2_9ARAC|nr:hypothetical protein JTE90_022787 [Oedothorax gibbosus]